MSAGTVLLCITLTLADPRARIRVLSIWRRLARMQLLSYLAGCLGAIISSKAQSGQNDRGHPLEEVPGQSLWRNFGEVVGYSDLA